MKKALIIGAVSLTVMTGQAQAQTQWIQDILSEDCSPQAAQTVANGTRQAIESSVARAHSSINAPAPTMDLSCINDLLAAPLDVFSGNSEFLANLGFNLQGMISSVTSGLKSGLSIETLANGVETAICRFAQEKFGEITGGLSQGLEGIVAGIALPNFTDSFTMSNTPGGGTSGPTWILGDMDNDGIPDDTDEDIDGDGVLNVDDYYPRDASRSERPHLSSSPPPTPGAATVTATGNANGTVTITSTPATTPGTTAPATTTTVPAPNFTGPGSNINTGPNTSNGTANSPINSIWNSIAGGN